MEYGKIETVTSATKMSIFLAKRPPQKKKMKKMEKMEKMKKIKEIKKEDKVDKVKVSARKTVDKLKNELPWYYHVLEFLNIR